MLPIGLWAALAALFGLAIGSFLNVVIYRVPAGASLTRPPSHCPSCGTPILARHNVPVLGWLMLRGRCHSCRTPISARYPLVELLTGALFAVVTVRIVGLHLSPAVPAYLWFVGVGIALAAIDLEHRRLPDRIVLPSYPVLAVLLLIATATSHDHDWWALARAGIGGVALYAFYYAIAFVYPAGMGFGDVKLSGLIGGVLGYLSWAALAVGAFGGFLLGSIGGIAVLAAGRGDRRTAIPFGPFMIAGAILAFFVARPIADAYLNHLH